MARLLHRLIAGVLPLIFMGAAAYAEPEVVVYIECKLNGVTSSGSGVLISEKGDVLTAKHVVPDGAACMGSIGVADPNTAARMITQPTNVPVDATVLRFSKPGTYDFVPFCGLEDWMVRREIIVAGFPGKTETGAISYRKGILSTVTPNAEGVLETDGQTVAGMSGGPVFSDNLKGLVGIVAGAKFAADGTISYFGIVPVSYYADAFKLQPTDEACYFQTHNVALNGPGTDGSTAFWQAGDPPIPLGIAVEDGFCFLTEVTGDFNAALDTVQVVEKDGSYELTGSNRSGGTHGGRARCIRY